MGIEFNKAEQASDVISYLKEASEVGVAGKFVFNNSLDSKERALIVGGFMENHSHLLKEAGFDYSKVTDIGDAGRILFYDEEDVENCQIRLWGESSTLHIDPHTDKGIARSATAKFLADMFKEFPNVKIVDDFEKKKNRK